VKESQIQRSILDLLAAERIPAWRMNTGAMSGEHKGKKWFMRFGEKGMADILAIPKKRECIPPLYIRDIPQVLWIEVKTADGKVTDDQRAFGNHVADNGMHYLIARSVDDVIKWLKDYR
jgi:hypothetical protein